MRTLFLATVMLGWIAPVHATTDPTSDPSARGYARIEPFDYHGVRLRDSRWRAQFESARDYYLGVDDDDILHGYRVAAGLPAPGKTLGGWAAKNSDIVFGQWLSGMARIYRATNDTELRAKAIHLLLEWEKTIGPDGDCRMRLYSYDKLLCGLVDLHEYGDYPPAAAILEKTLPWAMRTFSTERTPGSADLLNGRPSEWYTFAENLYRAGRATGNEQFKTFADSYLYPQFWGKFEKTASPADADHVHAYSHVNTFSSAAMAYERTGDPSLLSVLRNGYDFLQETQCYATGGYGPMERFVRPDGSLGRSLEARNATFETVCGSWAGFKMARYLQRFTGESRYGDWIEQLFYNGVGAALPIKEGGKHFYYSDYRVTGGMKVYKVSRYSCCSGTYLQCVADYHNLIYYQAPDALYVNLYLPSEVTWAGPGGTVKIVQETHYPEDDSARFTVTLDQPAKFKMKFRIPGWADAAALFVNEESINADAHSGTWATIDRIWNRNDVVEIRIPLNLRMVPVDKQHPRRVAVVRGPVVLVMDDWVFEEIPRLPEPNEVDQWILPDDRPGVFRIVPPDGHKVDAKFRPFYSIGEVVPYRMYHDLDALPISVW